jgi:hypothetical protein
VKIVGRASDNAIGRRLKKDIHKPHLKQQWVIAPEARAGFVANMEEAQRQRKRKRYDQRLIHEKAKCLASSRNASPQKKHANTKRVLAISLR